MGCLKGCLFSKHGSGEDEKMTNRSSDVFDWSHHAQIWGYLYKKPFGHQSNKWSKRFCFVKDGYLFYYREQERKEMERRKCISIHPKGFIPLGESVVHINTGETQFHTFTINNAELKTTYLLGAGSNYERNQWIEQLQKAQRITWKNAQLTDDMIKQLEAQGLQMAHQRQEYLNKLQEEITALSDEKQRTEELEQVNCELEKEKAKLEQYHEDMMKDYEQMKVELESKIDGMRNLEADSAELSQSLIEKDTVLQSLAKEKDKVLKQLEEKEKMISKEFEDHSQTEKLKKALLQIEDDTHSLLQDKSAAEERLQKNESTIQKLEEEKRTICDQASELKETIRDLRTQKEMTEAELKEEIVARMAAERKLRNANISLEKLNDAVTSQTPNIHCDIKQEMVTNVKNLKRFFDDMATEASIDSDKPVIVKNLVRIRKTIARRERRKTSTSFHAKSASQNIQKKNLPRRPVTTYIKGQQSDDNQDSVYL